MMNQRSERGGVDARKEDERRGGMQRKDGYIRGGTLVHDRD